MNNIYKQQATTSSNTKQRLTMFLSRSGTLKSKLHFYKVNLFRGVGDFLKKTSAAKIELTRVYNLYTTQLRTSDFFKLLNNSAIGVNKIIPARSLKKLSFA